jgi:hypothetical protein
MSLIRPVANMPTSLRKNNISFSGASLVVYSINYQSSTNSVIITGNWTTANGTPNRDIITVDSTVSVNQGFYTDNSTSGITDTLVTSSGYMVLGYPMSFNGLSVGLVTLLSKTGNVISAIPNVSGGNYALGACYLSGLDRYYIVGDFTSPKTKALALDNVFTTVSTWTPPIFATTGGRTGVPLGILPNGSDVLIYGDFYITTGTRQSIIRLDATTGSISTANPLNVGINGGIVYKVYIDNVILPLSSKLTIAGSFTTPSSGNYLIRTNPNGSLDATFVYALGLPINDMHIPTTGSLMGYILIATNTGAVKKLNYSDGSEASFSSVSATGDIHCISCMDDGTILIGGTFTAINGTARTGFAILDSAGNLL